jgi:DNA-binding NarL/FixJ family response regulator
MNMLPIRVLCVDDHAFLVEGLQARFGLVRDIEFVGRLATADNLVDEVKRTRANVVLLDIDMPGPDPFEALEDLTRMCPNTHAIMLSAYVRDHYIDAAVNAGAWGYLSKNDDPDVIVEAIRKVAKDEFVFGPEVLSRCNPPAKRRGSYVAPTAGSETESKLKLLTPREELVLRMIGKGLSRMEIARTLSRSPKTVDAQRSSIMRKLDIHTRVELARYAIREGLVEA